MEGTGTRESMSLDPRRSGTGIGYAVAGDAGTVVVFLAGRGASYASWTAQVGELSSLYRCVLVDLRGIGTSAPSEGPFDIRTFAQDTAALLAELGVERVHVVGASIGSAVAQVLCIEYPRLVASATLMSTWSSSRRHQAVRRWLEARMKALASGSADVYHAFSFLMVSASNLDSDSELLQGVVAPEADARLPADIAAEIAHYKAGLDHESDAALESIRCPTQIIYGSADVITIPAYNQDVGSRIEGAIVHEIPQAGHLLRLEAPAHVTRLVADFLWEVGP